jgi:hypothetical protein
MFLQTNNFKNAITQAKDFAINLPGGELLTEEQDDIIQMLETLRDRKRCASILSSFFFQWVHTHLQSSIGTVRSEEGYIYRRCS